MWAPISPVKQGEQCGCIGPMMGPPERLQPARVPWEDARLKPHHRSLATIYEQHARVAYAAQSTHVWPTAAARERLYRSAVPYPRRSATGTRRRGPRRQPRMPRQASVSGCAWARTRVGPGRGTGGSRAWQEGRVLGRVALGHRPTLYSAPPVPVSKSARRPSGPNSPHLVCRLATSRAVPGQGAAVLQAGLSWASAAIPPHSNTAAKAARLLPSAAPARQQARAHPPRQPHLRG